MKSRIFDHEPTDWQKLEEMVCQAFEEMGYRSERNYELSTVRGKVRIDVYAVNEKSPIPTVILCECKHWNKPVDQNVVYGFRTICDDVGAHYGLIISKKGFQSGADETRSSTNVHLLDFGVFQETFFQEWRTGVAMILAQLCDRLLPIMPGNPSSPIRERILAEYDLKYLFDKYSIFFGEHRFSTYFIQNNQFPIKITDPRGTPENSSKIIIETPRQYLEVAKSACSDVCKYFGI